MATVDEITMLLTTLASYYGQTINETMLKIYTRTLQDIDFRLLEKAAYNHMGTSHWMPKVDELRNAVYSIVSIDGEKTAMEAWGEVKDAAHKYGHTLYGGAVPKFSNDVIDRIVDSIGWNVICLRDFDQEEFMRQQFTKAYDALLERRRSDAIMLPEVRNEKRKLHSGDVVNKIRSLADGMRK